MREINDVTKLEFLMMVNDNIIVQRFFNVRDYNPDARNSVDFKDFMAHPMKPIVKEIDTYKK